MTEGDELPYTIESSMRIRLGPTAKEWAREFNMTLEEMARHILQQEKLRAAGLSQRSGES